MENKDFRSRLKNHKTPYNSDAWNQMSEFLDAMTIEEKEEKKKNRWGWLFLFGIIVIGFAVFGIGFYYFIESDSQALTMASEKKMENTDLNILENKLDSIQASNILQKENPISNQKEGPNNQTNLITQNNSTQTISKNKLTNKKNESLTNQQKQTYNKSIEIKMTQTDDLDQAEQLTKNTNETLQLQAFYNTKKLGNQSDINLKNEISVNDNLKVEKTDTRYSKLSMLPTKTLLLEDSINHKNKVYLKNKAPEINRLPKTKRLYLQGLFGRAWFNGNSGYHLSSGIFWDINKLIGLESNLAYSTGSNKSIIIDDIFTKESQVDLNILLHLNLHRSLQHKISVELGGGYTYYWGNRIVGPSQPIDVRKSRGWNLQGGLSYTYFFRRKHGIGCKVATIIYDDNVNFIAMRYLYKF